MRTCENMQNVMGSASLMATIDSVKFVDKMSSQLNDDPSSAQVVD
jgi:hypothetical protein